VPAKDRLHDIVKHALNKDGWIIDQEQIYLSDNQRHIWVDLSARRGESESLILIEVKGFENAASQVDAFMAAIGQYAFYKAMLEFLAYSNPLYLAIPLLSYEGIFQAPAAQRAIDNLGIWLLVFDPITEDIVRWIH
jgi:XisH protein